MLRAHAQANSIKFDQRLSLSEVLNLLTEVQFSLDDDISFECFIIYWIMFFYDLFMYYDFKNIQICSFLFNDHLCRGGREPKLRLPNDGYRLFAKLNCELN